MIKQPFIEIPIQIEVLTPVHIGMGEDYYPTDYVIADNKLHFIDRNKFTKHLMENEKWNEFVNVCSEQGDRAILSIRKFIKDNFHVGCSKYEVDNVCSDLEKKYNNPENTGHRGVISQTSIERIIRTSFYNEPILPGSSVKGAFMTALMNNMKDKTIISSGGFEHNKRTMNVVGQMISFSDFDLVKGSCGVKISKNIKFFGAEKDTQSVPSNKEHVSIGSAFVGKVKINTINKDFVRQYEAIVGQPILQFKKTFFQLINDFYFKDVYAFENDQFKYYKSSFNLGLVSENVAMLKIGKHSGAYGVTVHPLQKKQIKIMQGKGNKPKYGDNQTTVWTIDDLPMAWCKISEISSDEYRQKREIIKKRRSEYEEKLNNEKQEYDAFIESIRTANDEKKSKEEAIIKVKQEEKQKEEELLKKLAEMPEIDRMVFKILSFEVTQQNEQFVMNEFNAIDNCTAEDKIKLAGAIKGYFIKSDKWDVKPGKKQYDKVQKIKQTLGE